MKKIFIVLLTGLFINAQSQEIADALRYAQINTIGGTARFQAMSGAFGALGGDFSAINVNPAGSSVFNFTQLGVTLGSYNTRNKSSYFGTKTSENNSTFDVNQAGGILVFKNPMRESGWKQFAIAVNYENNNDFDNAIYTAGTNSNHSVADYFLSYANANPIIGQLGIPLNTLDTADFGSLNYADQQAFIGYQSHIISPDDETNPNNTTYHSDVPFGTYYHENYLESTGYNGKLAFNLSAQYKDRFYFGLNINSHFTDYTRSTSFYEDNTNSATTGVRNFVFNNNLHTYGDGFSFQFGAIAKITPSFRAGLAYESPTWYTLNDELDQTAESRGFFTPSPDPVLSTSDSNTDVVIVYDPYKLQTPGKWTGSLAYVFGKSGLISADFSIKDYSKTHFRTSGFETVNDQIDNTLDYTPEFRVGAEKRIKNWSLRAGYRYEASPYKDGKTVGDLTGISGGFGYTFRYTKLDLSYSYAQRTTQQQFFSQGFTDAPTIKSQYNNIALTLLFDL